MLSFRFLFCYFFLPSYIVIGIVKLGFLGPRIVKVLIFWHYFIYKEMISRRVYLDFSFRFYLAVNIWLLRLFGLLFVGFNMLSSIFFHFLGNQTGRSVRGCLERIDIVLHARLYVDLCS